MDHWLARGWYIHAMESYGMYQVKWKSVCNKASGEKGSLTYLGSGTPSVWNRRILILEKCMEGYIKLKKVISD